MIYNKIDYWAYIKENCADEEIKKSILHIYKNYKQMDSILKETMKGE